MVKTYTSSQVQSKPSNKLLHSLNPSFAIFTYPELQVKKGASQPSLVVHTFHHLHQKRSKLDLFPSQPPKPALKHFDLLLPNPSLSWWCLPSRSHLELIKQGEQKALSSPLLPSSVQNQYLNSGEEKERAANRKKK